MWFSNINTNITQQNTSGTTWCSSSSGPGGAAEEGGVGAREAGELEGGREEEVPGGDERPEAALLAGVQRHGQ